MLHQNLLLLSYSLGIPGGPGKAYQECEMVEKEFCEDIPKNEDVIRDVETCVSTPTEVSLNDRIYIIIFKCSGL